MEQLSGIGGAQAASENVVLADSLGYQALNAKAAKVRVRFGGDIDHQDALIQRVQLLEDSQTATKNAINKRRNLERMKGSSRIDPIKADDALAEMQEVSMRRILWSLGLNRRPTRSKRISQLGSTPHPKTFTLPSEVILVRHTRTCRLRF